MRRLKIAMLVTVIVAISMFGIILKLSGTATAVMPEPIILIGQIKITSSNGQFITLYNNSASIVNMNEIKLVYYNNSDLSQAPTGKLINLSGSLPPNSYYLISDDALAVCYKMTVNAMSLGFSSTSGIVQVNKTTQATPGGLIVTELLDAFAWNAWKKPTGSTATGPASIQTLAPFSLPSTTATPTAFLQRLWPVPGAPKTIGGGSWQTVVPNSANPCDLQTIADSANPVAPVTPPATTSAVVKASEQPIAPNLGLVAPEITELFPNPKDPQTDDNDEFIELYNPNDSPYALAGYRIEAGISYSRGYEFIDEVLHPKSYTAFTIVTTKLQLSNSEGQSRLLAPDGTVLSETPGYEDAPEGSGWGVVGDNWQWLDEPSPNAVNTADEEPVAVTKASTSSSKRSTGKVAGASTNTPINDESNLDDAAPLHPAVLAGVGFAAVAYALYEYRKDMANRIFQFRRYLRNRRATRT